MAPSRSIPHPELLLLHRRGAARPVLRRRRVGARTNDRRLAEPEKIASTADAEHPRLRRRRTRARGGRDGASGSGATRGAAPSGRTGHRPTGVREAPLGKRRRAGARRERRVAARGPPPRRESLRADGGSVRRDGNAASRGVRAASARRSARRDGGGKDGAGGGRSSPRGGGEGSREVRADDRAELIPEGTT